ncbi:DUF1707 SHOCT-like domain-containing protein [Sciscionella marina]|uniref:DUF1707 SHOCT-like domain-containing protein n=1 Tax=Sciscionella marina TaxID=508770 RepID=UPI000379FAF1|nr:DUF1707 domain-containing protein [Sciscionella marina]
MRASDAEREAVAGRLADAMGEGRLDLAEYEHRLDRANQAVTTDELDALHGDLPRSRAELDREERHAWRAEWSYFLGGSVLLTAIWGGICLAHGELRSFWPGIPIGIWALILISYLFWPEKQ